MSDLKFAFRQIRRNPGFAIVAVLILALGIGATTTIFGIVYPVVLRPLPFADSERLVAIWTHTAQVQRLPMAPANYLDLRSQNTVFEGVAILGRGGSRNLSGKGEPERVLAVPIGANLLPLLRVRPVLGRGFTEHESQPGRDRAAILSYGFWQRRYAGDPRIIGKTIRLDGVPHTVVGVMGAKFQYPSRQVQVWTPLMIDPGDLRTRTGFDYLCVARLRRGATLKQAQIQVNVIATRLEERYPMKNRDVAFSVTLLRRDIAGVAQRPLVMLLGAALGLLFIGCGNLAGLLLARALAKSRETAVRSALGASRRRLLRQAAVELLPILALGSLAGMLAASWGLKLMIPWLPSALPRLDEVHVRLPELVLSGAVQFIIGGLVLLLPAMQTARTDLVGGLRENPRTSTAAPAKAAVRKLLVVGQVALTFVLLASTGLLIRSFTALEEVKPGFRPRGLLTLHLRIPRDEHGGDAGVAAFCRRILERVRALPGIEAAAMGNRLPLEGSSGLSTIEFERSNRRPGEIKATDETTVTPDYFRAMGITMLQGRSFSERDATDAPRVLIVDERVARLAWPGKDPIGRRVRSGPGSPWAEVVGVVRHIRHVSLARDHRMQIYWNYLQRVRDQMVLVVRGSGDARRPVSLVLSAIKAVDPDQPAWAVRTLTEVLDQSLAMRLFALVVGSLFAISALLLAMLGIYGVIAWDVRQRTHEIGIRLALGAQRGSVLALVVRDGLRLACTGTVLGIIGAMPLARLLRGLLFGVRQADPLTLAAVAALLAGAALFACSLPARRAAGVDPMEALRYE